MSIRNQSHHWRGPSHHWKIVVEAILIMIVATFIASL